MFARSQVGGGSRIGVVRRATDNCYRSRKFYAVYCIVQCIVMFNNEFDVG